MAEVRKMALGGFIETARELNVDPDRIFHEFDLDSNFLTNIENDDMMDYELADNLVRSLATISGKHYCGMLMGIRQDIRFLGIIGYLMQQSNTVFEALTALSKYLSIHTTAPVKIEDYGRLSSINYINILPFNRQSYTNEVAMAQAMVVMKAICGNQFKPEALHFNHTRMSDITQYKKIFRAPIYFEQTRTELIYDSALNKQTILKADPLLKEILIKQIEQIQTDESDDIQNQIENLIRRSLQSQRYQIEHIANNLSMHPRTLQRKLKEAGISYSEVVENIRKEVATERLENSNITIMQLSDYLGYKDNTAFTRAFKKWFGVTPMQWRKGEK